MPANGNAGSEWDERQTLLMIAVVCGTAVLGAVLVEWPTLVWSSLHLDPALINPLRLFHVAWNWLFTRRWVLPRDWRGVVPSLRFVIVADVVAVVGVGLLMARVLLRVNLWGGRSRASLSAHDPRRRVRARAFGKARDWAHLQPERARSGRVARVLSAPFRPLVGERRRPAPRGGDGWNLGSLRGREVRSGPEQHLMVIAPTRSGKTMRVVATEAHEHDGALVVTSNKLDVVLHTIEARRERGTVWIYAPLSRLPEGLRAVGWSPLGHCRDWSGALRMGQWIYDADPDARRADGDGAARFYDRQAVERVLPPLLHAAALAGLSMADVYSWLIAGTDALDSAAEILVAHGAQDALAAVRALQALDPKPQSFALMSGAQLLAAYRLPEVQSFDHHEFDVEEFLAGCGTLYLIAPEGEQDTLAPILGAMLGAILRACEQRAASATDPRALPIVKILADEAAHLAPLAKLATYLSVSAGWGVRWCVVFQSVAQVRDRYGIAADSIAANTLCKLYLGPIHDRSTRDELLASLGEHAVRQTSQTTHAFGSSSSKTTHEQSRPKLGAEQLAQLGDGEAVAFHGRDLPAIVKLKFWWQWLGARSPEQALARSRERRRQRETGHRQ